MALGFIFLQLGRVIYLIPGTALFGVGFGFCFTATTVLALEFSNSGTRGTSMAVLFATYSAGVIMGQLFAGLGFEFDLPSTFILAIIQIGFALWIGFTFRHTSTPTVSLSRVEKI